MSETWKFGLIKGGGLTIEEVKRVLQATQTRGLTELVDGAFMDVCLRDGELVREPTDSGVVDPLEALFAQPKGSVDSELSSALELCVLIPDVRSDRYRIARSIDGVAGFAFKDLNVVIAELLGYQDETGKQYPDFLRALRKAHELAVAVVVGLRDEPY